MKEKKLISSTLAVVILTVIFLSLPICFFNADIQYKEKIIFAKGHDILPYSEGIRQFDLSEQTEQSISIELSPCSCVLGRVLIFWEQLILTD